MEMRTIDNQRNEVMDIAKGIGIILVMLSHGCGFPFAGYYITSYYIALFFVISGYFYKPGRSIKESIVRKGKRLLLPYLQYTLILFFLYCICGRFDTLQEAFAAISGAIYSRYCFYFPKDLPYNNRFFLMANSPLWFLTAMFISCIPFYLVVEIYLKNKWSRISVVTLFFIFMTWVLSKLPILLPWSLDFAFLGGLYDCGCIVKKI